MDFATTDEPIIPEQELEVDQINYFSWPELFDLSEPLPEIYEEDSSKPFAGVSFQKKPPTKRYEKSVHRSLYI
jgi:hypothetical protein